MGVCKLQNIHSIYSGCLLSASLDLRVFEGVVFKVRSISQGADPKNQNQNELPGFIQLTHL